MASVVFTPALRRFLRAPDTRVAGATVGEALEGVFGANPALRGYVLDDQGALRRHVAVYVNGEPVRDRTGLSDPVAPRRRDLCFPGPDGRLRGRVWPSGFMSARARVCSNWRGAAPGDARWDIVDVHFLGDPVSAVLAQGDTVHAALDLGHFGAKLWRRDGAAGWRELAGPVVSAETGRCLRRPASVVARQDLGRSSRAAFRAVCGPARCRAGCSAPTIAARAGR